MALDRDQTGRPTVVPESFRKYQPKPVEDCPRNEEIDAWLAHPVIVHNRSKSEGGRMVDFKEQRLEAPQTIANWNEVQIAQTKKWRVSIVTYPAGLSRNFEVTKDAPVAISGPPPSAEDLPDSAADKKKK